MKQESNRRTALIAALLLALMVGILLAPLRISAASGTGTVTRGENDTVTADGENHQYLVGFYQLNFDGDRLPVYCAQHDGPNGVGSAVVSDTDPTVSDKTIRKILYYGYLGPDEWSGFRTIGKDLKDDKRGHSGVQRAGYSITALALSNYCYSTYGYANQAYTDVNGLSEFREYLRSAAAPPADYQVYAVNVGVSGRQPMYAGRMEGPPDGKLTLKKIAEEPDSLLDELPGLYSLKGAVYTVTAEDGKKVGTLTTRADGTTNTLTLPAGTYKVQETTPSPGFLLDETVYTVSLEGKNEGTTQTVTAKEMPVYSDVSLIVTKTNAESSLANLPLAGAEYTVKYYAETGSISGKKPLRTWVLETGTQGTAHLRKTWLSTKKTSSEFFLGPDRKPILPRGTVTVEETNAPAGFARNNAVHTFVIDATKNHRAVNGYTAFTDAEKLQKIRLSLQKKDAETGKATPQTYGSFEGAEYEVFDGAGSLAGTIQTGADGKGTLEGLLPGTYTLRETKAPAGYLRSDAPLSVQADAEARNTAVFDYAVTAKEEPIRVAILKTEAGMEAAAGVPGARLCLLDAAGNTIHKWTTTEKPELFPALPAGRYTIHEDAPPDGYFPAEDQEILVEETAALQTFRFENERIPAIRTQAFYDNGAKEGPAGEAVLIRDQVFYEHLIPGKAYTLQAALVIAQGPADGDDAEGGSTGDEAADDAEPADSASQSGTLLAEAALTFTPAEADGSVLVPFDPLDTRKLAGAKLVVLETLTRNGKKVASHREHNDEAQTVSIAALATELTDKLDDGHTLAAESKATLVDHVAWQGLFPGKSYTLRGVLMDKETGKAITGADGKPIEATTTFTAEGAEGSTDLTFSFDAGLLAGKTIVGFETLLRDGIEVAAHADLQDEAQSVHVPAIRTKASCGAGSAALPLQKITVSDAVHYENLIEGRTYHYYGTLVEKSTGEPVPGPDGSPAAADEVFRCTRSSGSFTLQFQADASALRGKTISACGTLYTVQEDGSDGKQIAEHRGRNDAAQSIRIENPEASTTATIGGRKSAAEAKELTVQDNVRFRGLVPGESYTVLGTLMDKETGKPFLQDGQAVTSKKTFQAEAADGAVDITFRIDGTDLGGTTLVAFETVSYRGETILRHEDLKNAAQTVRITKRRPVPDTGDLAPIACYSGLLAGAAGLLAFLLIRKRRKEKA